MNAEDRPRRTKDGRLEWAVDLVQDGQGNCRSCGAPFYWIKGKSGKPMPMSEASAVRDDASQAHGPNVVWMASHFADCEQADEWRLG